MVLGRWLPRVARRVTLLQTFSVLSALVLISIAVLLGWRVQGVVEDNALKQETAVAIAQAQALVHTDLLPGDIAHPLAPAVLQRLAAYTRQSIAAGLFVRLKIWNAGGTVVYSDAPSLIGRRFSIDDDLDDILSGRAQTRADISDLTAPENISERGHFAHLLEVYVPIRVQAGATWRTIGAYELYHDLQLLDRQEADLRRAIWSSVAAGFLALYISLFLVVQNASRRLVRQSNRLEHQAMHDPLTGLPNRVLLQQRLRQATNAVPRGQATAALLLLDLDGFKEVNDTFGHPQGDTLLVAVTERLKGSVPAGAIVARLGGDEFAVLLPGGDLPAATGVAAGLLATLDAPFLVEGQPLHIGASVGIALYPDHGLDGATLLRRADVAMYAAKQAHRGVTLYDPAQDPHSPARLAFVSDLRAAIAQGSLTLHYQPQASLAGGLVSAVEALVRWPHPEQGLIPPDRFIPLAEELGLISQVTRWVLAAAVRQAAAWQRAGYDLAVSVNLSLWDLHDPALPGYVASLLREHGLAPRLLRLELTESALLSNPERTLIVLGRLRDLGLELAIDDFGSGYSSLAHLKVLPVQELKIDKGFVRHLASDPTDAAIVASTVRLGHALGLRVVAEGVEDEPSRRILTGLECDAMQGYYLSRPVPPEVLEQWLSSEAAATAAPATGEARHEGGAVGLAGGAR